MNAVNPTGRFSNRVADYRLYRPGYPAEVLKLLRSRLAPGPTVLVADIGSGTGIFTRHLLDTGYTTIAVEPNREMAAAAEAALSDTPGFAQLHAPAESLPFAETSIDLITVAQAFHWFDPEATRREFLRVLKPHGLIALIWNERRRDTDFDRAFDDLLHAKGTDYATVNPRLTGRQNMSRFWNDADRELHLFPNSQNLTREAFHGRVASASYTPAPGTPGFTELHTEVDRLFDQYQKDSTVEIRYDCEVYIGSVHEPKVE